MPIITIKPWKVQGTMEQKSTRWEITKDIEGLEKIKEVSTSGDDLYILNDMGALPDGIIVYVRPVRVFEGSEIPLNRVPIPLKRSFSKSTIYRDGSVVKKPNVFVNQDEYFNDKLPDFTIYTSSFSSTQDTHQSTNWVIKDTSGRVVLSYLRDAYNKTSMRINKTLVSGLEYFTILVQHVTDTGLESAFGELEVYRNKGEQFNCIREIDNVDPNRDLNIYIDPESRFRDGTITDIFLRTIDADGSSEFKTPISVPSNNPIVIPNRYLRYNSQSYLDIFSKDKNGNVVKTTIDIKTLPKVPTSDFKLDGKIARCTGALPELITNFSLTDYTMNTFLSSIPRSSILYNFNLEQNTNVSGVVYNIVRKVEREDIILPSTSNDGLYINKYGNIVVLESFNNDNRPTLTAYVYNSFKNSFDILNTVTRDDISCLGMSNNGIHHNGKFYLKPKNKNELLVFDYNKGTLETFIELPEQVKNGGLLFNRNVDKILVNGEDGYFRIVDLQAKAVISGGDLPFTYEEQEVMKTMELNNGDSLVMVLNRENNIIKLMVYKAIDHKFVDIDINLLRHPKHLGIIKSLNNETFLYQSDISGSKQLYRVY